LKQSGNNIGVIKLNTYNLKHELTESKQSVGSAQGFFPYCEQSDKNFRATLRDF
jgi:hypothetical protein